MIVFDLDGTLIDLDVPIEAVRAELRELFAARGHDAPMRPILAAIAEAARAVSGSASEAAALEIEARAILDEAERRATAAASFRPGLDAVAALEGTFALLTNNGRSCAELAAVRLAERGLELSAIVTRDDVTEAKPSPEGLIALWGELGRPPRMCFVGDSVLDIQAGRAFRESRECEIELVGALGGRSSADELTSAGADRLVADLAEFARRPQPL